MAAPPSAYKDRQLLAVIGDEDSVTGLLLAGVGHVTDPPDSQRNFLVVDSKTERSQIAEAFDRFTKERKDIGILLINQHIADVIRDHVDSFQDAFPAVLEIPSKDHPYDPEKDMSSRSLFGTTGQDPLLDDKQALDVPGENPLQYCADPKDYLLDIDYVDLSPNPPKPGEKLTISAHGTLAKDIEPGAKVFLQVKYGLITLIKQEADLCDNIGRIDLSCPLKKGPLVLTREVDIPKQVPPGKYTVHADVNTVDEEEVTCLESTKDLLRIGCGQLRPAAQTDQLRTSKPQTRPAPIESLTSSLANTRRPVAMYPTRRFRMPAVAPTVDVSGFEPTYKTYRSPYGPKAKTVPNFKGFTLTQAVRYGSIAAGFGVAAGVFALYFFGEVPRVRKDILQHAPVVGDYWVREIAPEDNPF
ncbi:hypothetical protein DV735_g2244, partial [Chaetothyriales sp. CBS 134920]